MDDDGIGGFREKKKTSLNSHSCHTVRELMGGRWRRWNDEVTRFSNYYYFQMTKHDVTNRLSSAEYTHNTFSNWNYESSLSLQRVKRNSQLSSLTFFSVESWKKHKFFPTTHAATASCVMFTELQQNFVECLFAFIRNMPFFSSKRVGAGDDEQRIFNFITKLKIFFSYFFVCLLPLLLFSVISSCLVVRFLNIFIATSREFLNGSKIDSIFSIHPWTDRDSDEQNVALSQFIWFTWNPIIVMTIIKNYKTSFSSRASEVGRAIIFHSCSCL